MIFYNCHHAILHKKSNLRIVANGKKNAKEKYYLSNLINAYLLIFECVYASPQKIWKTLETAHTILNWNVFNQFIRLRPDFFYMPCLYIEKKN